MSIAIHIVIVLSPSPKAESRVKGAIWPQAHKFEEQMTGEEMGSGYNRQMS